MTDADGTATGGGEGETVAWSVFLAEAEQRLSAVGIENASSEARWIVEEASGNEGSEFVPGLAEPATVRGVAHFDRMVARREKGEPLQYVLGRWAFRQLDLMVDARVLIPRPETETVAEAALAELDRIVEHLGPARNTPIPVVDLGTGSGALGLSLAVERTDTEVWATDASADAIAVARANLVGIGWAARRVRLAQGSWFEPLPDELAGRVGVIVSNPPYVAASDPLPREVAEWEPAGALIPGPTGMEAIETIVGGARPWLSGGGALVVEIASHQADEVDGLARTHGFTNVEIRPDLAGRPRTLVARTR